MASDPANKGSVFDILYADTRRLSSLLAQLSDDGIVTELVRSAEDTSTTRVGGSVKVVTADTTESGREATIRKIDPQWLLPLLFLDQAQSLIQRDVTEATIGSLALVQGSLAITDLRILQKMWSSPAMKKVMLKQIREAATDGAAQEAANRTERRAATKKQHDTTDAEAVLELLPILPHSPQINIITPEYAVWSTIEPEALAGTVEDLLLKHGPKIAGSWSMVGILDARPWEEREDEEYDDWLTPMEKIRMGMHGDNVWKVATDLAAPIRAALGRPFFSYAMTPLVIFREIEC